jgi:1-acyl-sn-glycerol-3-phosphate acyltransferase
MTPGAGLVRRLRGDYEEDPWGYDPGYAAAVQPVFDVLYDRWWRVRASGTEHVPAAGGVLVVANHGGLLPWDAAMVTTALTRAWAADPEVAAGRVALRRPRFLAGDDAFGVPWLGVGVRKCGGVAAGQANAARLLGDGHAVLAFPEGGRAATKPWSERHRLQRFGRGGFAETALRAGVPIVPCGIVGAEEAYPRLANVPALARLGRLPAFPITPTFPLLGPLGLVPLPSKWRIAFGAPVDTAALGPDAADDRAAVLELAERVRGDVQELVHDGLIQRAGAFT